MYSFLDDEDEKNVPDLKSYLAEKHNLDPQTLQPREVAQKQYDEQVDRSNTANLFANLGDVIAGKRPGQSNQFFSDLNKQTKENTTGKIDADRKRQMEDATFENSQKKAQRENDQFDENSQSSINFRNSLKANFPKVAAMYGDQFDKIAAGDQENIFKPLQLKEQINARVQAAALAAQGRADALTEKKVEKEKTLAVPGFSRTGEVTPSIPEAQKIRDAVAFSGDLEKKLKRMGELVDQNGSFEWGGTAGQEMLSLAKEIQLSGKGKQLYELGVLTGPDLGMLESITSDPSSISSLFTKDSTRKQQVNSQLESLKSKLQLSAESLGYKKNPSQDDGGQIKVINGKNYKKVQGGWEEI